MGRHLQRLQTRGGGGKVMSSPGLVDLSGVAGKAQALGPLPSHLRKVPAGRDYVVVLSLGSGTNPVPAVHVISWAARHAASSPSRTRIPQLSMGKIVTAQLSV